jgi:formate hydrogenlyase subunit 3/multisubunit Na+/H+ antiporter MnhD subunit
MIADILMAIIFMIAFWLDKERKIEETCQQSGIDVNMLILVGTILGFIILPLSIMKRIAERVNNDK